MRASISLASRAAIARTRSTSSRYRVPAAAAPFAAAAVRARADLAEICTRTVSQDRIDPGDVVGHDAVANRTRAGAIVRGHAADRRAARRRRIDREEQPVFFQTPVEFVQNDPRLNAHSARGGVERDHVAHVPADVHDQPVVHRLPALRRAAAARRHGHAVLARDRDRRFDVRRRARHDDAQRHDLIDRSVGRVHAARRAVEPHVARDLRAQARFKPARENGLARRCRALGRRRGPRSAQLRQRRANAQPPGSRGTRAPATRRRRAGSPRAPAPSAPRTAFRRASDR